MAEAQAQVIAAPGVQLAPGQAGAINLKIENAKLPIFYGQTNKDSVTAAYIIQRIQDLTATNHWSPEDAYHHFSLALQGSAQEWLRTVQQQSETAEKTWTFIEPMFRKEFSTDEDDTALLDQLSHLQKRPNEKVRDYASRINRIIELLQRSNIETPPVPAAADPNGHYTQAEVLAYGEKQKSKLFKFFALQLFKVGLPTDVRKVIHQQKPTTMIKAMDIARDQELITDKHKSVLAVQNDDDSQADVEAIQPQFRPHRPQQNYQQQRQNNWSKKPQQQQHMSYNRRPQQQQQQRPNTFNSQNRNNSSNGNSNKPMCIYCRIMGHTQDECRKRIAANAPCYSASGKPYYPKSVNEISNQDLAVNNVMPEPVFQF